MLFRQFVNDDLGCGSYLVGCEGAGVAAVVDPAFAIEQYLEEAERRGVRIVAVVETHTHADHLSGHGRFALEHGVPVHVSPIAGAEYPNVPLPDGAEIVLGNVVLRALHTPGHRPEHTSLAVIDRTRADEPWLVLTGDSLFVGDAARPDLAVGAVEGAEDLYGSLRRLLDLPDGVEVYPGHVSGSLCGAGMSSKGSSTIGFERRFNPALVRACCTVEEFIRETAAVEAPKPPNLQRIVGLNRGPWVGRPSELQPLSAGDGLTVLDVRSVEAFAAGHVAGAFNVPLHGNGFGTKAGFVLDPAERIAVHAESPAEALAAAAALNAVGFLDLAGYLSHPQLPTTLPLFTGVAAAMAAAADEGLLLVDVRDEHEFARGSVPGAINLPYRLLRARASELPHDRILLPLCESGARAGIAGSILAALGRDARPLVRGGVSEWRAAAAAASTPAPAR
jgi:hydroxyacylglutathione hydrolase